MAQAEAENAAKKAKRVAGYCLCGGEEIGHMVKCDRCKGKTSWYHVDCLTKLDVNLPFTANGRLPRGFKFICPRCVQVERLKS